MMGHWNSTLLCVVLCIVLVFIFLKEYLYFDMEWLFHNGCFVLNKRIPLQMNMTIKRIMIRELICILIHYTLTMNIFYTIHITCIHQYMINTHSYILFITIYHHKHTILKLL